MENEEIKKEYESLTEMQKRFIDYYIETANATKACQMAGYKGKNLNRLGSQNLSKLDKFIKIKLEEKESQRIASQDEVLQFLTSSMRGEIKDQFGLDAALQERIKCAELLGKRWGTFKEKVEHSGSIPVVINDDITE